MLQNVAKRFVKNLVQICTGIIFAPGIPQTTRDTLYKMDIKTKIMELIRELAEATTLAAQLGKNIDYLRSIGHAIKDVQQVDDLIRKAEILRSDIDKLNFDVIAHAPEY